MKSVIIGTFIALLTGIAIGTQATLSGKAGLELGSFRTGLLVNIAGGLMAGIILSAILVSRRFPVPQISRATTLMILTAGILGIFIVTGVSFSLRKTGVAAGLATIILGQMVVSMIVDTNGLGGIVVPLTAKRLSGIVLMGVSVYLLLPQK